MLLIQLTAGRRARCLPPLSERKTENKQVARIRCLAVGLAGREQTCVPFAWEDESELGSGNTSLVVSNTRMAQRPGTST